MLCMCDIVYLPIWGGGDICIFHLTLQTSSPFPAQNSFKFLMEYMGMFIHELNHRPRASDFAALITLSWTSSMSHEMTPSSQIVGATS